MSQSRAMISISNDNSRPHVVWVEPWASDYTLLPGELLDIRARRSNAVPSFHVVESDGHTQVYVQVPDPNHATFDVVQGDRTLECGHNRQAALDAGIRM